MAATLEQELRDELAQLGPDEQRALLIHAKALASGRRRRSPQDLLRHAGSIDADDLARMAAAIEEGCEGIDTDES